MNIKYKILALSACLLLACQSSEMQTLPSDKTPAHSGVSANKIALLDDNQLFIVDCLLPPQSRKMGSSFVYMTPYRPARLPAIDCEIRGGEYVSYDRANYQTALKVWLAQAHQGDAQAQYYVGRIYEQGMGLPPDYVEAARWYRKAADQQYARAQLQLGHFYEKGLGVAKDSLTALNWYRQAAGVRNDQLTFVSSIAAVQMSAEERRQWQLKTEKLKTQAAKRLKNLEKLQKDYAELSRERQQLLLAKESAEIALQVEQSKLAAERLQKRIETQRQEADLLLAQMDYPHIRVDEPAYQVMRGIREVQIPSVQTEQKISGLVKAPEGVQSFSVNGEPFPLDQFHRFWGKIPVKERMTPVLLEMTDNANRSTSLAFTLIREANAFSAPATKNVQPVPDLGKFYALVVGNNEYTTLPRLTTAVNDATQVADILKKRYGFETRLLINATRGRFLQALYQLQQQLTPEDNLLIYYAGHGERGNQLEAQEAKGYWLLTDAEYDQPQQWLDNTQLTQILEASPARRILVVADSCYAGTLSTATLVRPVMKDIPVDLNIRDARVRTVLTSGGVAPVMDQGTGIHSFFASAFLETLHENQTLMDGYGVYMRTLEKLHQYQAQYQQTEMAEPSYAPIKDAGHELGNFYFIPTAMAKRES